MLEADTNLIEKINATLSHCHNSTFYKNLFKNFSYAKGIQNIEQFQKLPFTTKNDLRSNSSFDFLATPRSQVRRIHSSSGTKGKPTIVFYSDADIKQWHEHLQRAFAMAHLESGDVFQTIVGYGLFSGGLGFEQAAEQYGMSVIPIGMGNTEKQVEFLINYKVNSFITISSYLPILAEYMTANHIQPKRDLNLKAIFIGAEPFNIRQRETLKAFFGVPIISIYGMSEMEGPGVAVECPYERGMHLFTDSYFAEIIDTVTQEPLNEGEEGELVLTTLSRECMPLVRFRTGDITKLYKDSCNCRSEYEWKIDYVRKRVDDMFIVKGVNIYPNQIQDILLNYKEIEPYLQIKIEQNDIVTLIISIKESANIKREQCELSILREIKTWFNISVKIAWVPLDNFINHTGKAKMVIDERVF